MYQTEPAKRFELLAYRLQGDCSTTELCRPDIKKQYAERDLNPQPSVYKTEALTVELSAQIIKRSRKSILLIFRLDDRRILSAIC